MPKKFDVIRAVFFDRNTVLMCPLCGEPSDGSYFNPVTREKTIHCPYCEAFYRFSVEIAHQKKEGED